MRVLLITNKWPSHGKPYVVPFLVAQANSLISAGVEISRFTFTGHRNPVNYFVAWRAIRHRFDFNQFDILHAHFGQCGVIGLPVRSPLVVTYHGSDLQGDLGDDGKYTPRGLIMQKISRWVARRATANILVSAHLQHFMPAKAGRVWVIPCGIDISLFQPQSKIEARRLLGLHPRKKYILFPAAPDLPVKRFSLANDAVQAIAAEFEIELIALGGTAPQEMPLYMNACDVLICTSSHEGSPTVIKEALACNLPVVSVPVGDVPRMLSGVAGSVVCSDDKLSSLSTALRNVLNSAEQINTRAVVSGLDVNVVANQIIDVYQTATRDFNKLR